MTENLELSLGRYVSGGGATYKHLQLTAIACCSSSLILLRFYADRAPQLKRRVRHPET